MKYLSLLLLAILSMGSSKAFAYDIAVKNEDGVTIYYNYINDGNELQVTRSDYQGLVNIPEEVTFENKKRKVTSIGDAAFYSCRRLGSVTIPNSVTIIGNQAFYECRGLSSVTIGNNVITIGLMAFYDCRSLSSIEIPNNVNTIRRSTFYNCI